MRVLKTVTLVLALALLVGYFPPQVNLSLYLLAWVTVVICVLYLLHEQRTHVKKEILKRNHKSSDILGGF